MKKSDLMERQFLSLKDAAQLFKRKEEEIMVYVESGVIPPAAYCYPLNFGDGKEIAFFPKKLEAAITAIPKEKPVIPKTKK